MYKLFVTNPDIGAQEGAHEGHHREVNDVLIFDQVLARFEGVFWISTLHR
jgi:hypothetical protein